MLDGRRRLRLAARTTAWCLAALLAHGAQAAKQDFSSTPVSADARALVDWVERSGDARGRPFAVVDKRSAHLYVFDRAGRLVGDTPAILGSAVGDRIAPNVGLHAQQGHVPFAERTTPAGRFDAEPGENMKGEPIVWVDYDSAFAIHRVRPGAGWKVRTQRLASDSARGKRLSWGCVVVPVAFYENVVGRVLGGSRSVVYVLPETRSLAEFLHALQQS
jgi:CubicO group peptidase (beta-lactamase class C family)